MAINIIRYKESDVEQFIALAKEAFPAHNVFYEPTNKIKEYLMEKNKENEKLGGVFFAYDNQKLVGGGLLKAEEKSKDMHVRYSYAHVVGTEDAKAAIISFFTKKIREDISKKLLKTAKIEVRLAENETNFKPDMNLYKKDGFKEECRLSSHYRHNEYVVVLGKEI